MLSYLAIKHIHLTAIALSFLFFLLRGGLAFVAPNALKKKWLKVLPHIIDTVLLISAIALAITLKQYPIADHWLTAKVVGLFAYISFAAVAMKPSKPASTRAMAFIAAIIAFMYIVGVAINHNPLSWAA